MLQTASPAFYLAMADLNRDGKTDLVTSKSIFLGNGDGTFQTGSDFGTIAGRRGALAVGDLNGDSNPDIVTPSGTSSEALSVFLGNGNGTTRSPVDYATGPGPQFVAMGDVSQDGKPDIVAVNGFTVSVLLGAGNGTLGARVDYDAPGSISVVIADVNRDANPDLVSAGYGDNGLTLYVFLGHGDGSFDSPVSHPLVGSKRPANRVLSSSRVPRMPSAHGSASAIDAYFGNDLALAAGDLNGDGTPDLAIAPNAYQNESTVGVLLGNGDGTFQTPVSYPTLDYVSSIAIGDVNGDGTRDIATANDYSATVTVLTGNGDGTFRAKVNYGVGGGGPLSVVIGDVSGDGKPEILVSNLGGATPNSGSVSILMANADATFQSTRDYSVGREPFSVVIADLDSDGKPDVATANWDQNNVSILYGNGDGSLQDRADVQTDYNPIWLEVSDLNGDGRLDLIVLNDYSSASVFLSSGARTFQPRTDYVLPAHRFVIGDVNGDQKADLVTVDGALLGNGDGTFGARVDYTTGEDAFAVALADLNGDQKPDIVTTHFSGVASVLLGNGDGTFRTSVDYGTLTNAGCLAIGDLNGDGNPDLLAGSLFPGGVSVFLGNGDGTFQTRADYGAGRVCRSVAVGDLDGDGKPDLAAVGSGGVFVLPGNGDGSFGEPTNYSAGWGPSDIAISDLDGDGKPDLVIPNRLSFTLSVLRNVGTRQSVLAALIDIDPGTINLSSNAAWITAYIEPSGFSPSDIDFSTVRLAGSVSPAAKFAKVVDHDADGVPELLVRFSRAGLDPLLAVGMNHLEVAGSLVTGQSFTGGASVRVTNPGHSAHHASVSPNPVNPEGSLSFYVGTPGIVRIRVFDRGGSLVKTILDASMPAGAHRVPINGRAESGIQMASGVYFYRVETPDGAVDGRFAIVK
jgi:hypothetical protein